MAKLSYSEDDRQYLQMMQENITRMASNSNSCKSWSVTIVAAFLALSCGIDALNGWILLAEQPAVAFWYLDVFYLHLERRMRNRELDFIIKAKALADDADNETKIALYNSALYNFAPLSKDTLTDEEKALGYVRTNDRWYSESEKTFYLCVFVVLLLITIILNWDSICSVFSWFCSLFGMQDI